MRTSNRHFTTKLDDLSLTALFILIKFWGLSQYPDIAKRFPRDMIHYSGQAVKRLPAPLHNFHSLVQHKPIRWLLKTLNELGLSGDLGHIIARKKITLNWIDALEHPTSQLQFIFLGGGLDYAPLYTSKRGITTFSLDSRAMISFKSNLLNNLGFAESKLHLIKSPPGASLKDHLVAHPSFKPGRHSIFVAEGLWDYLPRDRVSVILGEIRELTKPQLSTQLWSTLFVLNELSDYHRYIYERSVQSVGEQLLFDYTKQEFLDLVEQTGFQLRQVIGPSTIEKHLLKSMIPSLKCLKGFYMGQWQLDNITN
ncbi:MAG: class I SAM-dependent methyltransferase [Bacteroidota bacterium]